MRLLEQKRFMEAIENLRHLLKAFNFAAQRKASVTTFPTWLDSLCMADLRLKLDALGAFEVRLRRRRGRRPRLRCWPHKLALAVPVALGCFRRELGTRFVHSPPLNTRPPT
jgi:hypothetical protein